MLLREALPNLSRELITLLEAAREPGLAAQIDDLEMIERCGCNDSFCSSFYTAPRPEGAYGPKHRNVSLEPEHGMSILDVVDDRIMQVEVLFRDEIRSQLILLLP
jgi:hypothetical protein